MQQQSRTELILQSTIGRANVANSLFNLLTTAAGWPESLPNSAMPLYWLVYRHNNQTFIVIEPAPTLIHARMRASLDGLDQGEFTEAHKLDRKWKIAKEMIGRRLTEAEAKRLLAKF